MALGTVLVEDNFSTDGGGWGGGDDSGSNASDGERWGGQQMKLHSLTTHLLLCGPVPNRPQTGTGPRPGGWGPLLYSIDRRLTFTVLI